MSKKIVVIGSGGREHALCWKLSQSDHVKVIYAMPGSYEIGKTNKVINVTLFNPNCDHEKIADWCKENEIEMVVVGPEDPLANGLADVLLANGIRCFGPTKNGAQIEADKSWSKKFMRTWSIPTARFESFDDADKAKDFIRNAPFEALVVKASGLAAGKGVVVAENQEEACRAVDEMLKDKKFGSAGSTVVIEEKLTGEEISLLAFIDNSCIKVMLPAQDHKRIGNGDTGPNTGGMGAYCPCPLISKADLEFATKEILECTAAAFRSTNINYCGVLYAGLMLTPDGPRTLEFNCRFGDPETQVILPLLETDLYEVMLACCENRLSEIDLKWKPNLSAVGVIMASAGYPESSTKGCEITGLENKSSNQLIFHSGTSYSNGKYYTNGGRVLINVALASDLRSAAADATDGCSKIQFASPGAQFRTDIAQKAFKFINLSYKDSGVDIDAGDDLVQRIKPLARGTHRPGVIGGLGGFGGLFRLNELSYRNRAGQTVPFRDPVLVETTNGIGEKLKISVKTGQYESIGLDLVAMCVNDILCFGAQPIAFLDYIACGKLIVPVVAQIIKGIADGCRESGCALLGGETAEMPPLFEPGNYDLAGYSVGVIEYGQGIPRINDVQEGDLLIGLPSSGPHCSGFNLIHEVMRRYGENYSNIAPFSSENLTFAQEFLNPSKIYVTEVLPLIYNGTVKAAAHITSGGILKNLGKIIPAFYSAELDASLWNIPAMYGWLHANGLSALTVLNNFNCGIGMILIVPKSDENWKQIVGAKKIGSLINNNNGNKQPVSIRYFSDSLTQISKPFRDESSSIQEIHDSVDHNVKNEFLAEIKRLVAPTYGPQNCVSNGKHYYRVHPDGNATHKDPILVIGTDGIGSKILIAKLIQKYETIGVDLVAMCVNDILCNGATPITFLDYYACSHINPSISIDILAGVVDGVMQSDSALIDGKTIEIPLIYEDESEFDLAGFALGIVEHDAILPRMNDIKPGDLVVGLPSNGVHSNGFSLVHKLMKLGGFNFLEPAPFSACGKTFGEELLVPTKIYVSALKSLLKIKAIKAMAHITGGGLLENIPRVLPHNLAITLDFHQINIEPVFGWLSATGNIDDREMQKTYNCGIGAILVISPGNRQNVIDLVLPHGGRVIGSVISRKQTEPRVHIDANVFAANMKRVQRVISERKKRIGVLISGTGSNLQALIDATRNTTMGIGAEIVLVISNKENVLGVTRAKRAGIPTVCVLHSKYPSREVFDAAMDAELTSHKVDIICLAGFMRILSAEFVRKWKGRLINIHPSLLPKYPGLHVQRQALEAGEKESGCTIHFVDEGVDTGAIIFQQSVSVKEDDTEESLTERIHTAEHFAYPVALRMVATGVAKIN